MKKAILLLGIIAAFSVGCGGESMSHDEDLALEEIDSGQQAFTEPACPTQSEDFFLSVSGGNQSVSNFRNTPYGNSNCTEAVKAGIFASLAPKAALYGLWKAPFPSTQASCLAASVRSRLYERVNGVWTLRSTSTSAPTWTGSSCSALYSYHAPRKFNTNPWTMVVQAKQGSSLRAVEALLVSYN